MSYEQRDKAKEKEGRLIPYFRGLSMCVVGGRYLYRMRSKVCVVVQRERMWISEFE